jgi:hypothetical protein
MTVVGTHEISGALYTSDCAKGLKKQLYINDTKIQVFWGHDTMSLKE